MVTQNRNFLQPTGFTVSIERESYGNLQYFAQSIAHPGASMPPVELPTRRVTSVPLAGDKINLGELTIDFLLDEDLESYKEMQNWMERLVNEGHVSANEARKTGKAPSYADIRVNILSSHNNRTNTIVYHDAIPTNIGTINLAANVADVSFITFSGSFRFSYFEFV